MKRLALVGLAACGGPSGAPAHPAPSCAGAFTITSQEALVELGRCAHVEGDVTLRGAGAFDLRAAAAIESISGDLTFGPTFDLDAIGLEGVREVHDLRVVSNGTAGGVYFPRLVTVHGSVEIAANVAIAQVALPALETVGGDVTVAQNPSLEILDLGALARIDGTLTLGDATLTMVETRSLEHAGAVDLTGAGLPADHPLRNHAEKPD